MYVRTLVDIYVLTYFWLSVGQQANSQLKSTKLTNCCIYIYIYCIPPDDGQQICPKLVEVDCRNKVRINSASSWFLLHRCVEMDGQQNIKIKLFTFTRQFFIRVITCKKRSSPRIVSIIVCLKLQSLKILKNNRNYSPIYFPLMLITQCRITTKIKMLLSSNDG